MHPIEEQLIGIGGTDIISEEASGEARDVDSIIDDEIESEEEAEEELLGDGFRNDEVDIVVGDGDNDEDDHGDGDDDEDDHGDGDDDEDDHGHDDDDKPSVCIKIKVYGGKDDD